MLMWWKWVWRLWYRTICAHLTFSLDIVYLNQHKSSLQTQRMTFHKCTVYISMWSYASWSKFRISPDFSGAWRRTNPEASSSCRSTLLLMLAFSLGCILECVCAGLQPVRSHQSSLRLVEGRLGRGGVTKLSAGPLGAGFLSPGALPAERRHMCCGRAAVRSCIMYNLGTSVVAVRADMPEACGHVAARGGRSAWGREGHLINSLLRLNDVNPFSTPVQTVLKMKVVFEAHERDLNSTANIY